MLECIQRNYYTRIWNNENWTGRDWNIQMNNTDNSNDTQKWKIHKYANKSVALFSLE